METITIYSQCLAGYLMMRGFVLAGKKKNNDESGRNSFFFKKSEEINEAIRFFNSNKKAINDFIISQKG